MADHAGLPSVGPYATCGALSFRLLHEVSQAGAPGRNRTGGAKADSANLSGAGRRNSSGPRAARSRAFAPGCPSALISEPRDAGGERQNVASVIDGPSAAAEEFWGRHLWARGCFVASSGNVTDETIAEYIRLQGEDPAADERLEGVGLRETEPVSCGEPSVDFSRG